MRSVAGFLLLLSLGLAACATAAPPRPAAARLSATELTVTLSDGQKCLGPRAGATVDGPTGWAGTLSGCSLPLAYEVALDGRPNLLRQLVDGVFGVLGLEDALSPLAVVTLEGADGQIYTFRSPPHVALD